METSGAFNKSTEYKRGRAMSKSYIVVVGVAFVFLVVHASARSVPGNGNGDKGQALDMAASPVADPPSLSGVVDEKNIFGGVGGFAGMGGFIGGLFPHLGGVGVIGKYGGIGGGFGFGHGGFGGGVGGAGGVGGGVFPFP